MIEEIKKELLTEQYIIHDTYINLDVISVDDFKKVLDKHDEAINKCRAIMYKMAIEYKNVTTEDIENMPSYSELLKYKKAWEDLKAVIPAYLDFKKISNKMQELEQKYNLGGE